MVQMRLQKWLSEAGVCSRRQGEAYITGGRVRVNGQVVTVLGTKVDPQQDRVEVDGRAVKVSPDKIYVALHKPKGFISSCQHGDRQVVVDLVDLPARIYPIGRLDMDSTGLLLLTNDGRLHHRLSHPSFDHEKEYEVTVQAPIEDTQLVQLAEGMPILGSQTRPARVRRLSGRRFRIILQEGRNRQIRRMVRQLGHKVKRLHRVRIDQIHLGSMPEGAWRFLSTVERERLLRHAGVADKPLKPRRGRRE
jgi:23S rRNA pseudouridine2605 synthase/23S rRNA pseudouridine2604 synthase